MCCNTRLERLLSCKEVAAETGLSRSSIYRLLESDESFPKPISIGRRSRRWLGSDIAAWILERKALS